MHGNKIRRTDALLTAQVGDDLLMMSVEKGLYYSLNPTASRVWTLLENPVSVDEIMVRLLDEYEITDEASCRQDVEQFILALEQRDLLDVQP
jgi:hypothetical protein